MLTEILKILTEAVTAGAVEVLAARRDGDVAAQYKDAKELVTAADQRSDRAILQLFETRFKTLDPTIALRLEESGGSTETARHWAGADPLDGTNHFACGGTSYSVQAHYVSEGDPLVGVVFQPEVYLPLSETERALGRLIYAIRGEGAFVERTEFTGASFVTSAPRRLHKRIHPAMKSWVCCVPLSTKMTDEESARARRVLASGLIAVTTGVGGAGGNVMLTIFGGQHLYANFGAGEDLDLIPPQVIAEETGLTVWDAARRSPRWTVRKQPFIVAQDAAMAEQIFAAAGL